MASSLACGACSAWTALALAAAALLPCTRGAEEANHFESALAEDDACLGDETCALNALQLRRKSSSAQRMASLDPDSWFDHLKRALAGGGHEGAGAGETSHWDLGLQFADQDFEVAEVANDEVEQQLPFAKPGSDIPEGFHGVFWLDQNHASSIAKDPRYADSKPFSHPPSDETVVTFGDKPIGYDPQTNCAGPVPNYGGQKGHWTFLSTTGGRLQMRGSITSRLTADFCFDKAMEHVEVQAAVLVPFVKIWVFPPSWMFVMRMEKTAWGWDRVTTVGPNVTHFLNNAYYRSMLEKIFPEQLMKILESGDGGAFHYPFIRIVDGEGRRTKYYDEYLAYVSGESNGHSGKQVVGVLGEPKCDSGLFGTVARRRRLGRMCSCRRRGRREGAQASTDGKHLWRCNGDDMEYVGDVPVE